MYTVQGLTLVLDRHSHKVSAATVAEDFKGEIFSPVLKNLTHQYCKLKLQENKAKLVLLFLFWIHIGIQIRREKKEKRI